MKRKKAFVTGANGFLGANLVRELIMQGWDVTVYHRPGADLWRLEGLDLVRKEGSLHDPSTLEGSIPEGVDAVFHLAAKVSFWRGDDAAMQKANVEGTKNLVEAALRRKAGRFVHTSSVTVYGFTQGRVDENSPKKGLESSFGYLRTKAQAERVLLDAIPRGLYPVILNPANVVGPLDREHWGTSMRKVLEGKMPGAPPGISSFAHAGSVAKAQVAAVEKGRKGENYILGGVDASYAEVFSAMADFLGVKRNIRVIPKVFLRVYGEVGQALSVLTKKAPYVTPELVDWLSARMTYDSGKAVAQLEYRPTTLQKMLKDCWESLNPPTALH